MTAVLSGVWSTVLITDAIVILEVFAKKTGATPKAVIATWGERLKEYENAGK
jgi:phage-related protein